MSLAPLIAAPMSTQIHAFAAMAAFILGIIQFAAPKGVLPHRLLGWIWVSLMLSIALTSFWIHDINQWRGFSLIHLLSIFTLVMLPLAVMAARRHDRAAHSRAMVALFAGALFIAGAFTLMPGRVMHEVVFGG